MPGPYPEIPEHIRVEMEDEDHQEQVARLERRVRELANEVTSREQEIIDDLRARLKAAERVVEAQAKVVEWAEWNPDTHVVAAQGSMEAEVEEAKILYRAYREEYPDD